MCERVAFTAWGSRAQCVKGPCFYRPASVSCVGERAGSVANWIWKCSATLDEGLEIVNPIIKCSDTSRCDGSSCSVDYTIVSSRSYSSLATKNYYDPWDVAIVTLLMLVILYLLFRSLTEPYARPAPPITTPPPSYYDPWYYSWRWSPWYGYRRDNYYYVRPTAATEPSQHRSESYASGPSFSGASTSTAPRTTSTSYGTGPSFSGASTSDRRRTSTAEASGPSFG